MRNLKKEFLLFCIFLLLFSSSFVLADEFGCCSNPGAGDRSCSFGITIGLVSRDTACCPKPETDTRFQGYYKSQQNPNGPSNFNDCSTNFFFPNKDCSTIDACGLGCCCSTSGGSITSGTQCQGTGLVFHKGETNCNQICRIPQCNDGIDNDNNGCADFPSDTACPSPDTLVESGGTCALQGAVCNNPNYVPRLSNLLINPLKGQRKFLLNWQDECSETSASYEILRCKGIGCTNFENAGTTNKNSFEDASGDLLLDAVYTYQVKAHYILISAIPATTPKAAFLGNLECLGQASSGNFCVHNFYYDQYKSYLQANFPNIFTNFADGVKNTFGDKFNKAFSCDDSNKLVPQGPSPSCSSSQACIVNNNQPSCINKVDCNYANANPFGLFYTLDDCENNRYCFFDRSNTIVNSCFNCDPSMACYDYKSEDACRRDNCNVGRCAWKSVADQIGIGACVSTIQYNCEWCDSKGTSSLGNIGAFNNVFDFCTKDKSDLLSQGDFSCYFTNGKSKNCNDVMCTDYSPDQCANSRISHDENNIITNPSLDACGLQVCQNMNNACAKNADGDSQADCNNNVCESDYFPPNTTLLPVLNKGKTDRLIVQVYDKTGFSSPAILKTSLEYSTFLCVEPCGASGHPYDTSTKSRTIIISNLNAFDASNGGKLLSFAEGTNIIRFYSQDPAKNIEQVKRISIEAHSNSSGPKVVSINVTGGTNIIGKIFTNNQKPTIDVQFFEPAIVTFARISSKNSTKIVSLQSNPEPNTKISFQVPEELASGEYSFDMNAKNSKNIFMDAPLSQAIIIDKNNPALRIDPANGTVVNTSNVAIKLTFDKEVNLNAVKVNSDDFKNSFTTSDNKIFTATINLSDGNKNIEVAASDFANNNIISSSTFIVYSHTNSISLANPRFGVSPQFIFDLQVNTDNNANCRYSIDSNFEFNFMEPFAISGGTIHTAPGFNKIASGDTSVHRLFVRCSDERGSYSNSFDLSVDQTPPKITNSFAFPNPVIESQSNTTLTIETDEPSICKYSATSANFDQMEEKFDGFDNNIFRVINRQSVTTEKEGNFSYKVACRNKAGLNSDTVQISFQVDFSVGLSIISHTPPFFNSTKIVLALETNKKSQCKFSESDSTAQSGEIFGVPSYSHTRQISSTPGTHIFYIICKDPFLQKFSNVLPMQFTIDVTPPIILSVNDSSILDDKPDFTWDKDSLRVKWYSIDNESKVRAHFFSIIDSATLNTVLNWTTSFLNNEFVVATNANGTSLNLANGNRYFFRVKAQNIVGLVSNITESDGVTIDTSLKPLNCSNGVKDERETDVDCGGRCGFCDLGKKCSINIDCKINFCNNGICSSPKCDDSAKNSDESDVDCGGSCKRCQNSKACNANNDCESGFCSFGFCKPQESCLDGKLTAGETDVDCGGHCPVKCPEGKACNLNDDCADNAQCISSLCKKCSDNDKNCNGIPDDQENAAKDTDADGMSDDWEIKNGLNPNDPNDAKMDNDKDGLANSDEYKYRTNPNLADTDGDKFTDKQEIDTKTNPLDPKDFPKSNAKNTIFFILGIVILISGAGFLAYRAVAKKKSGKFESNIFKEIPKASMQQPSQIPSPHQKGIEEEKMRENLRRKEERKLAERRKLLDVFGEEKQATKEMSQSKKPAELAKQEIKPQNKAQIKPQAQKSKEDSFKKLKEITKSAKKKK